MRMLSKKSSYILVEEGTIRFIIPAMRLRHRKFSAGFPLMVLKAGIPIPVLL